MSTKDPYIFLFNADDKNLECVNGAICTCKVIKALDSLDDKIASQIMIGNVIIDWFCSSISEISKTNTTVKFVKKADVQFYKLVICDFVDSLKENWHSIDTKLLALQLGRHNTFAVMLVSIEKESANQISQLLEKFSPYLGGIAVDTGNPIHCMIFPLLGRAFYKDKTLYFRSESPIESLLLLNDKRTQYFKSDPIKLNYEEFSYKSPSSLQQEPLSVRGKISLSKLNKKKKYPYYKNLTPLILEHLKNNPEIKDFYYSTKLQQDETDLILEKDKFVKYLLNVDHSKGGPKAKFFIESLGIEQKDWKYLSDQIAQAMKNAIILKLKDNEYGITHSAILRINGRNDRDMYIETGWQIIKGKGARLLTAYPYDKKNNFELPKTVNRIAPQNYRKNDKWSNIYSMANSAGLDAYNNCIPTPFIMKGFPPTLEGKCGFSCIRIKETRNSFVKWLKTNNIGSRNSVSDWSISVDYNQTNNPHCCFQSFEPKIAYTEAFAKVLHKNDIMCEVINIED